MVLEGIFVSLREEFFLELLIAKCGAVLVREVPFLKGSIGDGHREFAILRFQSHYPVAVVPAAWL